MPKRKSNDGTPKRDAHLVHLETFRRSLPHVSGSALSCILQEIEEQGLPQLKQRKHFQQARDHLLSKYTAYGPLLTSISLECANGSTIQIPCANFLSLLDACYRDESSMIGLLNDTANKHNPSATTPWHLIAYNDEVVAGNPLGSDTTRKMQLVYFSFAEVGPIQLSKEESWICCLAIRSSLIADVCGGMSQVMSALLKMVLHNEKCYVQDSGIVLKNSTSELKIFFKLGYFLQDGLAQKTIWSLKGDSGTRFCLYCQNLVTSRSGIEGGVLTSNSFDLSSIVQSTDKSLQRTIERIAANHTTMSHDDFALWQQATGFNFCKQSLPWDPLLGSALLPREMFTHDWMHTFFVTGVFNIMTQLVMDEIDASFRVNAYQMAQSCIEHWVLPGDKSNVYHLLSQKHRKANKQAGVFKCAAGEALSLYPLLAFFFQHVVLRAGGCANHIAAYCAMADLIDLIQVIPLQIVSCELLEDAVASFLQACLACSLLSSMTTKFHWLLHLPFHVKKFEAKGLGRMLPSCFVQERKHKVAKRYAENICNTSKFESSILQEIICHDLAQLKGSNSFQCKARLEKESPVPKKLAAFLKQHFGRNPANSATCNSAFLDPAGKCQRKDVVVLKNSELCVAHIWFHASFDDKIVSLVSLWEIQEFNKHQGHATCKKVDDAVLIDTSRILSAVPWCMLTEDTYRILVPVHLRS